MNKRILITLAFFIIITALFAYLNRVDKSDRELNQENAVISIKYRDERRLISFSDLRKLQEYSFDAVLRSSGKEKKNTYKGILLKELLEAEGIKGSDIYQVITRAVDGYTVTLSGQEILEDDNVYIVYEINGKRLKTKEEGGSGPYQLIIRKDAFGQRWNKFLMELDIR